MLGKEKAGKLNTPRFDFGDEAKTGIESPSPVLNKEQQKEEIERLRKVQKGLQKPEELSDHAYRGPGAKYN